MLTGVTLTVDYPDDSVEAAIPSEMLVEQVSGFLKRLIDNEPDATSFVLVAAIKKEN